MKILLEIILYNMASKAIFRDRTKMLVSSKRYKQISEAAQTIKISLEFERLNDKNIQV